MILYVPPTARKRKSVPPQVVSVPPLGALSELSRRQSAPVTSGSNPSPGRRVVDDDLADTGDLADRGAANHERHDGHAAGGVAVLDDERPVTGRLRHGERDSSRHEERSQGRADDDCSPHDDHSIG